MFLDKLDRIIIAYTDSRRSPFAYSVHSYNRRLFERTDKERTGRMREMMRNEKNISSVFQLLSDNSSYHKFLVDPGGH